MLHDDDRMPMDWPPVEGIRVPVMLVACDQFSKSARQGSSQVDVASQCSK